MKIKEFFRTKGKAVAATAALALPLAVAEPSQAALSTEAQAMVTAVSTAFTDLAGAIASMATANLGVAVPCPPPVAIGPSSLLPGAAGFVPYVAGLDKLLVSYWLDGEGFDEFRADPARIQRRIQRREALRPGRDRTGL